jgi:uncharacterized protein with FMN-binding domain
MASPSTATPTSDDQIAERLARLQQRRQPAAAPTESPTKSPTRAKRRHPAARARAAALLLALATTGGLGALFADLNSARITPQAVSAGPAPTPVGAAQGAAQGFNGSVVNTKYGPVQVQAQISGGAITDVAVITAPDQDNKSRTINARALPQLRSEVLTAQRAVVDAVSGATYTSNAYRQSLQAAIDAARSAGATAIA